MIIDSTHVSIFVRESYGKLIIWEESFLINEKRLKSRLSDLPLIILIVSGLRVFSFFDGGKGLRQRVDLREITRNIKHDKDFANSASCTEIKDCGSFQRSKQSIRNFIT